MVGRIYIMNLGLKGLKASKLHKLMWLAYCLHVCLRVVYTLFFPCRVLESEDGIHCNMTLLFAFAQVKTIFAWLRIAPKTVLCPVVLLCSYYATLPLPYS